MAFDQAKYWIDRHERLKGDPRSVGDARRTLEESEAGEQATRKVVSSIAARLGGRSVLDLGCGYGRVASCFIDAGMEYYGIDVSPAAIQEAGRKCPTGHFSVEDLNEWLPSRTYDIVCAFYVFIHFVDDEKWHGIVETSARAVATGGSLVIADDFPAERSSVMHAVRRPLAVYRDTLERMGFHWDERFADELTRDLPAIKLAQHYQRFLSTRPG